MDRYNFTPKMVVRHGDIIRLEHYNTQKNLHSHSGIFMLVRRGVGERRRGERGRREVERIKPLLTACEGTDRQSRSSRR